MWWVLNYEEGKKWFVVGKSLIRWDDNLLKWIIEMKVK